MKTKTFKIGEYAVGGKIQVIITGKVIQIKVKDWTTDEILREGSGMTTDFDIRGKIDRFLIEVTTSYYTDKIIEWIESKVKLNEDGIFKNLS